MSIGRRSRSNVSKSRPVVFRRDGRECVVAGLWESVKWPCAGGLTVQHRRGRGMGGSAVWDEPDCLVAMCAAHNVLETADADFKKACLKFGWSVPRWVADQYAMSRIPVRYADGWWLLSGDGRYSISDNTAQTLIEEIYGSLFE